LLSTQIHTLVLVFVFYLFLRFSFLLDVVFWYVWYCNSGIIIFVQQFLRLGWKKLILEYYKCIWWYSLLLSYLYDKSTVNWTKQNNFWQTYRRTSGKNVPFITRKRAVAVDDDNINNGFKYILHHIYICKHNNRSKNNKYMSSVQLRVFCSTTYKSLK
jgi:hypothetical protein